MNLDYRTKTHSRQADLEEIIRAASAPKPETLAGWEFRGYNVPWFTKLLGIQKFIKGYFPAGPGRVEGYNIPVRQNGFENPWEHLPDADAPKRFGFYKVLPFDPAARDNYYPASILLNYGASAHNPFYRVERVIRDYLVQPDPKNPDIVLGKAYLALAPGARVFSNFFVLERLRKTEWKP